MALGHHRHSADCLGYGIALALGLAGCTPPSAPPPAAAPTTATVTPRSATPATAGLDPLSDPDACPHRDGADTLRLTYDAFGPGAMAFELLGQRWWQWDGEGHDFDDDHDVIWIVVHDDIDPAALSLRFPVRPKARCDHRYVAREAALKYLAGNITELEGAEELADLRATLQQTQSSVRVHFDSPRQR